MGIKLKRTIPHEYLVLTEILIQTANDFGLEYKENPNFWKALKKHMRMLKILSRPDSTVPRYGKSAAMVG